MTSIGIIGAGNIGRAIATTLAVRGRVPAAFGVGSLAFIVPAIGLVKPSILRGAFLTLSYLTWPIGWVVSHVILAIVYYAVLTPIALLLRLFKYDPLTRRMDRGASTYWKPVSTSPIERYFRQH